MNFLDLIILVIFIAFIVDGLRRGVIKEIVSLVGIIIVFILSFSLKGIIGNVLCYIFPFFHFSGAIEGLTTINIFFYQTIAFLIVFSLLFTIYELCLKISKIIQKVVNMTIILWIPSKILGGVVSFLKGYLIMYAIFLMILVPFSNTFIIRESKIMNTMVYHTPVLSSYTNNFITPLKDVYDLGKKVTKKEISIEEANQKSLDIMLKYKVVSKSTVKKLIEMEKLDNISNIDEILEKY